MPPWLSLAALSALLCSACVGELVGGEAGDLVADPDEPGVPEPVSDGDDGGEPEPDPVQPMPPPPGQGDPIPLRVVDTNGLGLRLRTGPGTEYGIITVVPEGCIVIPAGVPELGWLPVDWRGQMGWVYGGYLEHADGADCSS